MIKKIIMTNEQIYTLAMDLAQVQNELADISLPIKINFYIAKNIAKLKALGVEIENARLNIGKKYGVLNKENTSYEVPQEQMELAQKDLQDLSLLEQEVEVYVVTLEDFNDVYLTYSQISILEFMIVESEDN